MNEDELKDNKVQKEVKDKDKISDKNKYYSVN